MRTVLVFGIIALLSACSGDAPDSVPTPVTSGPDGGSPWGEWDAAVAPDGACAASQFKVKAPSVDIIVGVDTSNSMSKETSQVKANLNAFATKIGASGLDYQVILLGAKGTGAEQICVPPPLAGASCADNAPIFHHIDVALGAHAGLATLLSTYDSADAKLNWQKYARPSAHKVFVYITDADAQTSAQAFDAALLAKSPAGMFGTASARKYTFDSICGWADGTKYLSSQACSTASAAGLAYQQVALLSGGIIDSVCKSSFDGVFSNLAKGVTDKLSCSFDLPASSGTIDTTRVAVNYVPGSGPKKGQPSTLTQVTDASKCAQFPDGWYYDDPSKPTKVTLCKLGCDAVAADVGAEIDVAVGCSVPPPK